MTADWVITLTFDTDPTMETMDHWEHELLSVDGSVARIPGHGVDVTTYLPGDLRMLDAAAQAESTVGRVVPAEPIGVEILREPEWRRRAEAPTMPELMSTAEIAEELSVSRQRVHQLRELPDFPAPLAELGGGAVWDALAVRTFARTWDRKPGRPRHPR